MKKFVSLVLALALVLGMSAISLPAASADATTELIVWVLGPGEQADHDKVMAKFNEQLAEALPGISADISIMSGEYKDILNRALAAGERIDLAWIGWHHDINQMAVDGNLKPLDDLIASDGQDIVAALGDDTLNNHRSMDGHLYQIPTWQGMVGGRSASYLLGDIVDLCGEGWLEQTQAIAYEFMDTNDVEKQSELFAQYDIYLQAAMDNGKLGSGIDWQFINYPGFNIGSRWSVSYGAIDYDDPEFKVYWNGDTELVKNYYRKAAEWYDKGFTRSDILSYVSTTDWKDGITDQDFITSGHNAWTDNYGSKLTQEYGGLPCEVVYNYKFNNYNLGRATGMCIPYTGEHDKEAMQLLNQMYCNKDLYTTFVFGLEGDHYTVLDDGSLELIGGSSQANADWAYGQWCWTFGTCNLLTKTQNPTHDPAWYQQLKDLETIAWSSPFITFSFDKTNVETQIAAMDPINKEYGDVLNRGVKGADGWEAYFNEYADLLKANGLDDVLAEIQAQVDAFRELNGITEWNFPKNSSL